MLHPGMPCTKNTYAHRYWLPEYMSVYGCMHLGKHAYKHIHIFMQVCMYTCALCYVMLM